MQHDRDDYRALGTHALLRAAREYGLNPEMAIAITERLATENYMQHTVGYYGWDASYNITRHEGAAYRRLHPKLINHSTGGN